MRNRPIVTVAVVIVIGLIAFALIGIVREFIAPWVLRTFWRAYLMAESIPQVMIWAFFVAAIPMLAIFVLIQGRANVEDDSGQSRENTTGQVFHWIKQIQRSSSGDYFKRNFIRQLSELTFATLEYRERMTENQARDALKKEYFHSESGIGNYLAQGWQRERFPLSERKSAIKRLTRIPRSQSIERDGEPWRDPRMEEVIEFLEKELEV